MGEDADPAMPFRVPGLEPLSPENHLPLRRFQAPGENPKKCGLPGSVGPEHGHELAGPRVKLTSSTARIGPNSRTRPDAFRTGSGEGGVLGDRVLESGEVEGPRSLHATQLKSAL